MTQGKETYWTPEMDALLGTMSDQDVADKLGVSRCVTQHHRGSLGIPSFCIYKIQWTPKMDAVLGTMSDRKVADELDLGRLAAWARRQELGILSWKEQNRVLPPDIGAKTSEAGRIYSSRRRHRKLGVTDTLTYEQWRFACKWFGYRCAYCDRDTSILTEDHLRPLSKGGSRTALNLIPACWSCNSSKQARRADQWIYEKFGMEEGKKIVERIVVYLTEVKDECNTDRCEEVRGDSSGSRCA